MRDCIHALLVLRLVLFQCIFASEYKRLSSLFTIRRLTVSKQLWIKSLNWVLFTVLSVLFNPVSMIRSDSFFFFQYNFIEHTHVQLIFTKDNLQENENYNLKLTKKKPNTIKTLVVT